MHNSDKILFLTESLDSGGAERQLVSLAVSLKQKNETAEVWTYYPNDFYLPLLQQANVAYRCVAKGLNRGKRLMKIIGELYKERPSVVIAYLDTACAMACMSRIILRLVGRNFRLIVSERNVTQELCWRDKMKFLLYRFADYIVPNSYTQGDFLRQNYSSLSDKVRVITNFVDADFFYPKEKKREEKRAIRVLTVARINSQKNVENYLRSIKKIVAAGLPIQVDWYGEAADKGYYQRCCKEVADLDLTSVVKFHHATRDVRSLYWSADVFSLPSLYEGFPNVLCEAMSCGLPIVCSRVCDNERIVKEHENAELFNPNDVDDMAQKIVSVVRLSDENRRQMGQRSREIIEMKFLSDSFINQYLDLIHG